MLIKNIAAGGRGIGVAAVDPTKEPGTHIEWTAGETKDIDAAVIARAKKDPTNAALLADGGDLVEVTTRAARAEAAESDGDAKGSKK